MRGSIMLGNFFPRDVTRKTNAVAQSETCDLGFNCRTIVALANEIKFNVEGRIAQSFYHFDQVALSFALDQPADTEQLERAVVGRGMNRLESARVNAVRDQQTIDSGVDRLNHFDFPR